MPLATQLMSSVQCLSTTNATLTRFGEIPNYREGLYQVSEGAYAWMVPNGSWGETNTGLITGKGESLLIDTLWDTKCTQMMLDHMHPIVEQNPIHYIMNTHSDGDHFWGNQLFPNCDIYATQACSDLMHHMKPKSLIAFRASGKALSYVPIGGCNHIGHWFHNMVAAYDFKNVVITPANQTFKGEKTLNVGGKEVVLIEQGPAHTSGDAMVYLPDSKVLYSGDLLFIDVTPVLWAGPSENWIKALENILTMDVDYIVPGHGSITDKDGVRKVKNYWEFVNDETFKRHRAGLSASEAAKDIVKSDAFKESEFYRWDSAERIMTSAHTIYRHLDGKGDQFFSTPKMLSVLAKQAKLAFDMPWCTPKNMHQLVD